MKVPLTIADFLERGARVYRDRIAAVDEPDQPAKPMAEMTYGRLHDLARAQAARLDGLGIGVGERVAVVSHNSTRLLASFFGVGGFGRVLVPINFRLNAAEVRYIVEHSGASLLLVDPALEDDLRSIPCRRLVFGRDDDEIYDHAGEPDPWPRDEDATATINYTSGTTARPKGVQMTHRNIWLNATTFGWHTTVTDADTYLHTLPMFHCNGWGMLFATAGMGVKQVVIRRIDGHEILRRVERHDVTLMCGAPTVVAAILDAASDFAEVPGRGRVRIVVAGAPPPTRTVERVESELGWEFIQIYGLTETAPLLTINRTRAEWADLPARERASKLARAGAPALGVELAVDPTGEVLARGNHVMAGYWNNPEASQEALAGGWFHTGDGGSIDADNYLTINDRKKDVIITGGENVSSIEVEDVLHEHDSVHEVAVVGVPDEKWGETVIALVVPAPGKQVREAELIEHCRSRLAHYKCPTRIELRQELPRTATGKLQKFKLREPYWQGRDLSGSG